MGSIPTAALPLGPLGTGGLTPLAGLNLKKQNPKDLAGVCREVESVFLTQLLTQMHRTMVSSINPGSSQWDKGYLSLCEQQVAQALAAGGGIGLAQRLYEQLSVHRTSRPGKEIHDGCPRESVTSGTPDQPGDFPVPGTPGLPGAGGPGPGQGPGGDDPESGRG